MTEDLCLRGDATAALAEALCAAGQDADAAAGTATARELYAAKGNVAAVRALPAAHETAASRGLEPRG